MATIEIDEDPILNDIAASYRDSGMSVLLVREGRGVLGSFDNVTRCNGRTDYSTQPPAPGRPTDFWSLNYYDAAGASTPFGIVRKAEIVSHRGLAALKVRKVNYNTYHIIVQA